MKDIYKYMDKKLIVRRSFLILLDILVMNFASLCAIVTRFDFRIAGVPLEYSEAVIRYAPLYTAITIVIFFIFRLYHSLWRYASIEEMTNVIYACTITALFNYIGMKLFNIHVPRSFYPLNLLFLICFVSGSRFFYRTLRMMNNRYRMDKQKHIMIIGAGEAASAIIKEITTSKYLDGKIVCAIDDNKSKIGSYIQGVKIVGSRYDIKSSVEKYTVTDIIIAIPSSSKKELKPILDICKETNCSLKILPGMYQIINNQISVSKLRNVEIEDLIGRDIIELDTESIMNYVSNKVVMVTGGGGSIGSELCRQIVKHKPKQLIIVDIYENNAYDIQQELINLYPELDLVVLIASVRNTNRMEYIFKAYRPELVYHAAAHKHVPLMEVSPNEAIKNNVFGTLKLVKASDKYGVKKFVQISTDKAVNPTNIMGASKRICEMIIQTYNNRSNTEFVAVRFGNVLGSNGSVIPLFKKQILQGGPVTVTHPDIIRYFMTIPEAVSLVLQAGAFAKGGEIFVLDMGEPVRIAELANNLIRLSGFTPGRDIAIEYIGLRPGEKLFEELLLDEEGLQDTANKMIHIGKPIPLDEEKFLQDLEELYMEVICESDNIKEIVHQIVPTYIEKSEI
ncbi:FlaA1/EpsC-like NDP-sugar epimerase [Mobilisporobacter senegalensis]|uniref:FlaA1/EpsC-like NDP-sugar epimerase n=1 Tax=Mobilisporobacter senegalensis TaxID=1329262 RepID=A0A3N1Y1K9_9FIRM|nr:nucleoside-diphosphate sugar epimerase/dehydratase [Mobilisporobacter senegalensis]ROR31402.1 FlaA1/EpsC-like NDP-sugar epimerase [Mobilisporobacter senegalensis]